MQREIEDPTLNERDEEQHPAFGRVVVNRVNSTPGAVLFDSDIRHGEYVRLTVHAARRKRDLNQDWIYADDELIEIQLTLAQWASMVSSFGNGGGVSCTITERRKYDGPFLIPALRFKSRMAIATDETVTTAEKVFGRIRETFKAYKTTKKAPELRALELAIDHAAGNIQFATKSLTEYVETSVQHARADIEAMVNQHARSIGIDPVDVLQSLASETQAATPQIEQAPYVWKVGDPVLTADDVKSLPIGTRFALTTTRSYLPTSRLYYTRVNGGVITHMGSHYPTEAFGFVTDEAYEVTHLPAEEA